MKVQVFIQLTEAIETIINGEAPSLEHGASIIKVEAESPEIGFWVNNWHFGKESGPAHKNPVFIPWGSVLYIISLEKED